MVCPVRTQRRGHLKGRVSVASVVALSMALTACGHRSDIMSPVPVAATGTAKVDMLVATTRKRDKNPALFYNGERDGGINLDNVVISIPPDKNRQVGQIQWPGTSKPDPTRNFVTEKAAPLSESEIMPWFKRTSRGKRRVVVFVHGFNNTYASSVYRFAQLMHDARIDAAPVLFTWPSRGNMLDYVYDRESTIYSRYGLGELLSAVTESTDVADVTVIAHSMGTWLTMEALRDMAMRNGRVSPKIHSVVLASPDIDIDVFQRQLKEMGEKRPRFTIFSSRNDLALRVSGWIAGDVQRLGTADISRYRDIFAKQGITVVDASDASQSDPLGHNAFAENADILNSLGNTFLTKPEQRAPRLLSAGVLLPLDLVRLGQ